MLSYTFSLTETQLFDFFKKYRAKLVRSLLFFSIALFVLAAAFLVWHILDAEADYITEIIVFACFGIIMAILCGGVKKGAKTQSSVYFKTCQVDGLVTYEYQLGEKEFTLLQPARGNVSHYYYDLIIKVTEIDGFVSVLLESNQCLPIPVTDDTRPLIDTFKSLAKQK